MIGGYAIVRAATKDEAIALAQRVVDVHVAAGVHEFEMEIRPLYDMHEGCASVAPAPAETTMRFMMLMIPKGYETAAPGTMPDADGVAAMMKYNESLQKAGVLLALDGLHPPSMGARVTLRGRQAEGHRRPVRRSEGSAGRLLDDPGEVERRGDRVGVALPGLRERGDRGPPGAGVRGLPGRRAEGGRGPAGDAAAARAALKEEPWCRC